MSLLIKENLEKSIYAVLDKLMNTKREQTFSKTFFDKVYQSIDNSEGFLATPWNVSWQVCAECNLRCKHCFFEGKEELYNKNLDLSTEKMLSLVDELAEDCSIVNLTITGGEPFLRKDIFEIIEKIKSKNIVLWLQTNATLITDEKAHRLSKILNPQLDCVQISLDGACEDYHNKIRGDNAFSRTFEGIKNLTKYSVPIAVNTTVLNSNLNELVSIYKTCIDLKVKKFSITRFIPSNDSQNYLIPDVERVLEVLFELIKIESENKDNFRFEINALKFYDLVSEPQYREIVDKYLKEKKIKPPILCENISCHLHNILYINCDGAVSFCFMANDKDGILGNVKNESLMEIWSKREKNLFFKPRLISNMLCKKCKYFAFCKGGCMASANIFYKNPNYPDGFCKYAKEQFQL